MSKTENSSKQISFKEKSQYECPGLKENQKKDSQSRLKKFHGKLIVFKRALRFLLPNSKETQRDVFKEELIKLRDSKDLSHISSELSVEELKELDLRYGVANSLSLEYGAYFRYVLILLTICGGILAFSFLLYDELNWSFSMFVCGGMIACLIVIHWWANNSQCHKNYLEFRVLAESFRVQYFLSVAGVDKKVVDMLPGFVKKGPVWICDVLDELPEFSKPKEKKRILNFWIRNQLSYNENAFKKKSKQKNNRDLFTLVAIIITILVYVFAIFFELYVANPPVSFDVMWSRIILKIILGIASVFTLCIDSYYGKMSLDDVIEDHRRMAELYKDAEEKIIHEGESQKVLIGLAYDFLIENSIWYAYQNQNKPNLVL